MTLCCPTVLSSQDSPDASWEPMAKLSVSCMWMHQRPRAMGRGASGVLSNISLPHRASSLLSACVGSATPALQTTWVLMTSTAIMPLRALVMRICSAPSQDSPSPSKGLR